MSKTEDIDLSEILKTLKELEDKMGKLSTILEKFGLDIITKMGQTNLKVNMLTDKINELNKATIDIKGLTPQLSNIIENQKTVESKLELIQTLILKFSSSPQEKIVTESVERNESATDKKESIINQLNNLKEEVEENDDPQVIKAMLEKIKGDIFEFTGGHRILYEISQTIIRLDSVNSLNDLFDEEKQSLGTLENYLKEKIVFWINKLMVKS